MKKLLSPTYSFSTKPLLIGVILLIIASCSSDKKEAPYLFGSGFGINSTGMLVEDLEAAKTYFE